MKKGMNKRYVSSNRSPAAVGPYSQAVAAGGLLFTSGILPLEVDTGTLVGGGIEAETRKVLENLQALLEEGGASFATVLKTTVFITDMDDFSAMNAVYGEFFGSSVPARATVEVGALAKGAHVEIEAIALTEEAARHSETT